MRLMAMESWVSRVKVQGRAGCEGVAFFAKEPGGFLVVAFGVALEDRGCGDCHGGVEEHLHRAGQPAGLHSLPQVEQDFLCPLQGKGGDDDIASVFEGIDDSGVQFFDGLVDRPVETVTVGGFHDHDIRFRR